MLTALATTSAWRAGLDGRFTCGAPTPISILGGAPGLVLSCTRKVSGWPQVALVATIRGTAYYADGILPALPVLQRAIGVLSGTISAAAAPAQPPGQADALFAARLAAQSFSAGDIGQYQSLMQAGLKANLAESYAAAEQAFRAALQLQRKALGDGNPATAITMMQLALQLSDEGRFTEADALFAQAEPLAARSDTETTVPRLDHYRGLAALNEEQPQAALPLLRAAEIGYDALLPPALLATGGGRPPISGRSRVSFASDTPMEPDQQAALIGVIEVRRYQAIALRALHQNQAARAMIQSAAALASARGLRQQDLTARLYRTASLVDDSLGEGGGAASMRLAVADFADAQPGSRPLAQTYLLRAGEALHGGAPGQAIGFCRQADALLTQLHAGSSAELVAPCLSAYAAQAAQAPADSQPLLSDMFEMAELVQGSVTSQQIALASARLVAGGRNPHVAAAIRSQQDAAIALADLERQHDVAAEQGNAVADIGKKIDAARAALADADTVLQAAAPNYAELVQQVVPTRAVLAALQPGEALAKIILTPRDGWIFVLRDGQIAVAPTIGGSTELGALVQRVRASVEPQGAQPPPFAIAAAQALYADTLGRLAPRLDGARAVVVVPAGPLLAMPFELMLTGPADPANLAAAPWLVRRYAISHVPAAANFVSLRKASALAQADKPWFGFGDFQPVTLAQAESSFPSASCQDSARQLAGLPPLPYAKQELQVARLLLGGNSADALEGASYTVPAALGEDLRAYRVLHFATHALLPTDLRCQSEPAIVTSDPHGATNAAGALLTAADVMGMHLNADIVIVSACNSAGPDGSPAGESLSGLARAFFYAGARGVMVTHWSVNDKTSAYLIANTLKLLKSTPSLGAAGALRGAQLALLDQAGRTLPAQLAHPFFWAPFALVGEGAALQTE